MADDHGTCPHCGGTAPATAEFCPACGRALPRESQGPRVVSRSGELARTRLGQKVQSGALERKLKSASGALLAVAILNTLGIALLYGQVRNALDDPEVGGTAKLLLYSQVGVAVIFFGLWAWSRSSPLPAAIAGLVVFLSLVFVGALADPKSIAQGLIIKVIVIVVLGKAIAAGVQHQRLLREEAAA